MLRTRWRQLLALVELTLTLLAGMPCLCAARALPPQTAAHACCPQRAAASPTRASTRAVGPSHPPCAHCAGGHVDAVGTAVVSLNAAAPLWGIAADVPDATVVPGRAVDRLASHRQPPGGAERLFVVFRSLLL